MSSLTRTKTLRDLYDAFVIDHVERRENKPASVAEMARIFEREILGKLGAKTKIVELLMKDGVPLEKNPVAIWHAGNKGAPYVANRAIGYLNGALELAAVRKGWIPHGLNPCRHVGRYDENRRERYPDVGELERLEASALWLRDHNYMTNASYDAIRLLILTGCRRNEVLRLAWEANTAGALGWVDMRSGALRYWDSKTGAKHIALSEEALELLEARREANVSGSPWVFEGKRKGKPLAGIQLAFERTCEHAEVKGICVHSLRHSFATRMLDAGVETVVVQALLGHGDIRSTQGYQHATLNTQKDAFAALRKKQQQQTKKAPTPPAAPAAPTFRLKKAPTSREVPQSIN